MRHIPLKAGDMFVFTGAQLFGACAWQALATLRCCARAEALTHGTLPWGADHERRTIYYLYHPFYMSGGASLSPEQEGQLGDVAKALVAAGKWETHPQSIGQLAAKRL